ncbi:cutinase-domain-containing protein [Xylariales sp. PMI_506]|nr:cutinase-domain-containing protein [Xylariales sp. PMI_506]
MARASAIYALTLATTLFSFRVSADCDDVHLFLARGNNEEYPGRQGAIADALCDGLSLSCSYENIIFSANLTDVYCTSVYEGAVNGISQLTAYAEECPDSMLVLSGYSQGANVVGDILGGGGGQIWGECTEGWVNPIEYGSSPANQIVGVLMFGDPRHVAGQSYNYLDGAEDNSYAERNSTMLAALDNYASVMRSYCGAGDPVCASGDDVDIHLTYLELYSNSSTDWIKSINGWNITSSTTTATTSTATVISSSSATSSTAATIKTSATSSTSSSGGSTAGATAATTNAVSTTASSKAGLRVGFSSVWLALGVLVACL